MKRNIILKISEIFVKTLTGLTLLLGIIYIFVMIHSAYTPQIYERAVMDLSRGLNITYNSDFVPAPKTHAEYIAMDTNAIYISCIDFWTRFNSIVLAIISFSGMAYLFIQILKFITSVKNSNSFFVNNARAFRKIGFIVLALFFINQLYIFWGNSAKLIFEDGTQSIHQNIHLSVSGLIGTLIFVSLTLIASEVFKEGERIRKENELTI